MQLSTFLRQQADLAHDGKIPQSTRDQISAVESAERAMQYGLGECEAAYMTLANAVAEVADCHAVYRMVDTARRARGDAPQDAEAMLRAYKQYMDALEWLEHCGLKIREALRHARFPAAPAGGA